VELSKLTDFNWFEMGENEMWEMKLKAWKFGLKKCRRKFELEWKKLLWNSKAKKFRKFKKCQK
jgi:hypothetical protein